MATKPATAKPAVAKNKTSAKPAKAAAKPPTNAQLATEVAALEKSVKSLQTEVTAATKHTAAKPSEKHSTAKKTPAKAKAGSAKHATATTTKRGLSLHSDVMCCSAEALAASARIAGLTVTDDDVLTLHLMTARYPDAPASILATLKTAERFGLGEHKVSGFEPAAWCWPGTVAGLSLPGGPHSVAIDSGGVWTWGEFRPASTTYLSMAIEEAWAVSWQ